MPKQAAKLTVRETYQGKTWEERAQNLRRLLQDAVPGSGRVLGGAKKADPGRRKK